MNVACLACLQPLPSEKVLACPHCKMPVPQKYNETSLSFPPQAIVAAGYPNHGKTTLIKSLMLSLEVANRKADGLTSRGVDNETRELIRRFRADVANRDDAKSTREVLRFLLELGGLKGIRKGSDYFFRLYDLPGEMLHQFEQEDQPLPFPAQSLVVWMVVSLSVLKDRNDGHHMASLLDSVHRALQRMNPDGAEPVQKTLVVIYTMADKFSFTPEIERYYRTDPFAEVLKNDADIECESNFNWTEYLDQAHGISDQLEEFTRTAVDRGRLFLLSAKALGYDLRFCITSAQGGDAQKGKLQQFEPKRVIDPLLLSLGLNATPPPKPAARPRFALVLDASAKPGSLYASKLQLHLWNELNDRGCDVTCYYLGVRRPISHPGQHPPADADHYPRLRLIGPILESLPLDTHAVALSNGPIIDLQDFLGSWRSRATLVRLDGLQDDRWPDVFPYQEGNTAKMIVDYLFQRRTLKED